MKKLNTIFGIAAVLLLAGALFLSCTLDSGDYGTLIVKLPGSGSARAVSDAYKSKLYYRVTCDGPGTVTRDFSAGQKAAISLAAGDWTVSVTVHISGSPKTIGESDKMPVTIEAGKTTPLEMFIGIETHHNDIISFTISNSNFRVTGKPDTSNNITLYVPYGSISYDYNNPTMVSYSAVHEGVELVCSGETLGKLPVYVNCTFNIIVTAEDGTTKSCRAMVEEQEEVIPGYGTWPTATEWASFGLPNYSQPPATTLVMAYNIPGFMLMVSLQGSGITLNYINNLILSIETAVGATGSQTGDGFYNEYNLAYYSGGAYYTLNMSFPSIFSSENYLSIMVYSFVTGTEWPANWEEYNLTGGLTLPSPATVAYTAEFSGGEAGAGYDSHLVVVLENADTSVYTDLKGQLHTKLSVDTGAASITDLQENTDTMFVNFFRAVSGFPEINATLLLDVDSGELTIMLTRY